MTIYFIQEDMPQGAIKIGYTDGSPEVRLKDLQTGNPRPLKVIAEAPGSLDLERLIHLRLRNAHIHGEWFYPVAEVFSYIDHLTKVKEKKSC